MALSAAWQAWVLATFSSWPLSFQQQEIEMIKAGVINIYMCVIIWQIVAVAWVAVSNIVLNSNFLNNSEEFGHFGIVAAIILTLQGFHRHNVKFPPHVPLYSHVW